MAKQNKNQNQGQSINYSQITCNWGGMTLQIPSAVIQEYQQHSCCPPSNQIFRAFELCPLDRVKVVIIGQDPYYQPGKADGLAFSQKNTSFTNNDSLFYIDQELKRSKEGKIKATDLQGWAKKGVLLMNTWLSVRENIIKSHRNKGWETLTENILEQLIKDNKSKVFLIWGGDAKKLINKCYRKYVQNQTKTKVIFTNSHPQIRELNNHLFLYSAHPSPRSVKNSKVKYPFINNDHFKKANEFLKKHGVPPIDWNT